MKIIVKLARRLEQQPHIYLTQILEAHITTISKPAVMPVLL